MKKTKNKDILCFHDVKPFRHKILVCFIDKKLTRFTEVLNKKENKFYSKWLKDKVESFVLDDDTNGMIIYQKDCQYPVCLLLLNNPRLDTLRHEVCHLIDLLSKYYSFQDELEFKAYLFNDLYEDIIKIYVTTRKTR